MRFRVLVVCVVVSVSALGYDPRNGDFSKDQESDIRLVAYNVQQNFIADPARDEAFNRLLTVLDPDIIVFQEMSTAVVAAHIKTRLEALLPAAPGAWETHFGRPDGPPVVIASRFPLLIKRTDTIPAASTRGVCLALADLPDQEYGSDVYLLGMHWKSGSSSDDFDKRQRSADATVAWLGNIIRYGGIGVPDDTPMIALGDFNIRTGGGPEHTMLTGDIDNEEVFGPDAKCDWDLSNLTDLRPTDPFDGDPDTWPSGGGYPNWRFDRFFFTDSVTTVVHAFIVNTYSMAPNVLQAAGLQATDTSPDTTSDHLPIVMDIRPPQALPQPLLMVY